jgi:hypothetical protein
MEPLAFLNRFFGLKGQFRVNFQAHVPVKAIGLLIDRLEEVCCILYVLNG